MSDLTPVPATPGLHISKASPTATATATAACHCGAVRTVRGDDNVRALAADYTAHRDSHRRKGQA